MVQMCFIENKYVLLQRPIQRFDLADNRFVFYFLWVKPEFEPTNPFFEIL